MKKQVACSHGVQNVRKNSSYGNSDNLRMGNHARVYEENQRQVMSLHFLKL